MTSKIIAAAEIVLRRSHSHVSLTQSLGLDTGSQRFALQKDVKAVQVKLDLAKCSLTHWTQNSI